jgi:proline dehydrogenase
MGSALVQMGLLLRLARQWIAGENAEQGIERVKRANSKGILGLLNLLGEHIKSKDDVERTSREYERLLDLIDQERVSSQISIKPTQLGLSISYDYCLQNYLKLAQKCVEHNNNYLWIDMENSPFTQKTIDIYSAVLSKFPNTGLAVQAYLRRSESDIRYLLPLGAKIRLVKGAYNETPDITFKSKREISENYARLLGLLFAESTKENFVAVATHDGKMILAAKDLAGKFTNVRYEYEMLMGVRDNLKKELVSEGKQVREYVPYGPEWLPYSIRRIREKKSNIFLLARSLITQ